jgi:UDP-2,3-diacylglucosamine pyrophosphatase LpxH
MTTSGKTIVVSDIHMSNQSAYSWFSDKNKEKFINFLGTLSKDDQVNELIILGDFIDLWLYPLDIVPLTPQKIFDINPDVVQAIQACVENIPNVYYMNGNHDMELTEADLAPLSSGGKSVRMLTTEEYSKKYNDKRHLEHGHMVDMFNAPDNSPDTLGGFSFGYYITRIVAQKETGAHTEIMGKLADLVQKLHTSHISLGSEVTLGSSFGHFFISAIITALELYTGVNDKTQIRYSDPDLDKKNYTVGDLRDHYGSLFDTWFKNWGDNLLNTMLTGLLPEGLNWYSNIVLSKPSPPAVLVMGHTHHAIDTPYDNDGCWCDSGSLSDKTPHYVEITGDTAKVISF